MGLCPTRAVQDSCTRVEDETKDNPPPKASVTDVDRHDLSGRRRVRLVLCASQAGPACDESGRNLDEVVVRGFVTTTGRFGDRPKELHIRAAEAGGKPESLQFDVLRTSTLDRVRGYGRRAELCVLPRECNLTEAKAWLHKHTSARHTITIEFVLVRPEKKAEARVHPVSRLVAEADEMRKNFLKEHEKEHQAYLEWVREALAPRVVDKSPVRVEDAAPYAAVYRLMRPGQKLAPHIQPAVDEYLRRKAAGSTIGSTSTSGSSGMPS